MSDDIDLKPDGTPTLGTVVLWAGQGAEADGQISFDDLQLMRELSSLLREFKVTDIATLRTLLERR